MLNADAGLGDDDDFDMEAAEDLLEAKDPRAVERERLRPRTGDNTLTLVVRKRDYRLLEVQRK